jgi:hypothetical protein
VNAVVQLDPHAMRVDPAFRDGVRTERIADNLRPESLLLSNEIIVMTPATPLS